VRVGRRDVRLVAMLNMLFCLFKYNSSECPAPKTPLTNSSVPDFRIYETAGQLAATVADLH